MPTSSSKTTSGKIYDPVFIFMLAAVILAVGSSFILRAAVSGFGMATTNGETVSHSANAAQQPHPRTDDADP